MLTKNFYAMLGASFLRGNYSTVNHIKKVDGGTFNATDIEGTTSFLLGAIRSAYPSGIPSTGVVFSDDKKQSTVEDFEPRGNVNSSLKITSPTDSTISYTPDGVSISATFGVSVISSASNAITINSVWLIGKASGNANALYDHSVLKSPIIIAPGESKQITYTIRFKYPKSGA